MFALIICAVGVAAHLPVNIVIMALATLGVAHYSPEYIQAAFNPVTLNLSVISLYCGLAFFTHAGLSESLPSQAVQGATMISIYERALGADFFKLHPQIQRRFSLHSQSGVGAVGSGTMERIWHGAPYTLPFLYVGTYGVIMFPNMEKDVPFTIENYAYIDPLGRETVSWVRTFSTKRKRRFDAYMIFSEERGCIIDYLGTHQHLAVDIEVSVADNGGLRLALRATLLRRPGRPFRFPWLFTGVADVCEWCMTTIRNASASM